MEIPSSFDRNAHMLFNHFPFRDYLTLWIAQLTAIEWLARRRKAYDLRKDSPPGAEGLSDAQLSDSLFWIVLKECIITM